MAATDFSGCPYGLDDAGVLRHKVSGRIPTSVFYQGKYHTPREVTLALTPKAKPQARPRMSIIEHASKFYVRSKDGSVHSTRYTSREKAAEAARKMAAGLIHFSPTIDQINRANLSNPT